MPSQLGRLNLSVTGTAASFSSVPTGTTQAILRCETAPVRWRADGTAPTSSAGALMNVGDVLLLVGNDYGDMLRTLQFIRTTATSGTIEGVALNGFDRA